MASTKCSGLSSSGTPPPPSTMSGKRLAESSPMKTTLKFMSPFFSIPTPTNATKATVPTTTTAIGKPRASTTTTTTTKPISKSKSAPPAASATTKAAVIDWQLNKPEVIRVDALNIHYTSLRDIIPTAMLLQCKQDPSSHPSSSEVINVCCGSPTRTRMKNHLVEQAARAYLQPLNLECNKSTQFFPWNWQKLMGYTPLTFSIQGCCSGYGGSIKSFFSSFTKISLSRTLRYLLGRVRPHPMIGFLQQPRIR